MGDLQSPALPLGYVANFIRFQPKPRICPHSRQQLFDCLYLYFACAKRSVSVIHYPRPALLVKCSKSNYHLLHKLFHTYQVFFGSCLSYLLVTEGNTRKGTKRRVEQSKALSSEPLVAKGKPTFN